MFTASTTLAVTDGDLIPIFIVLAIALGLFIGYMIYVLLSIPCFKTFMMSCLHRFCLLMVRRRRMYREKNKEVGLKCIYISCHSLLQQNGSKSC